MKSVLIVGNLYSLVSYLQDKTSKIYVIAADNITGDNFEKVDIRENAPAEILNFVLENDIDLTIVTSKSAIKSDIVDYFQSNGKLIFAPSNESSLFINSLSYAKKFLYRLHAPVNTFAIFDKMPLALDYLQTVEYPIVISNDTNTQKTCCTTFKTAKCFVEDLFLQGEEKIVIEKYIYSHPFTFYVITDGYHALPLCNVRDFNFSENGDGGYLTSGVGCYVPDLKISNDVSNDIYNNVILRILDTLQKADTPYVGIIGVNAGLLSDGSYKVFGFKPFFDKIDIDAVLNLMDENLLELFEACATGSFADEYDEILTNDNVSVSCLISSKKENIQIINLESVDSKINYLTNKNLSVRGENFVFTACAKTLSRAKDILKDDIELISFDGMKCRSDIYS